MDIKPNRPLRVGSKIVRSGSSDSNLLTDVDAAREELAAEDDAGQTYLRQIVTDLIAASSSEIHARLDKLDERISSVASSASPNLAEFASAELVTGVGNEIISLSERVSEMEKAIDGISKTQEADAELKSETSSGAKAVKPAKTS